MNKKRKIKFSPEVIQQLKEIVHERENAIKDEDYINSANNHQWPYTALFGQNESGEVVELVTIYDTKGNIPGCRWSPIISTDQITDAIVELSKKGATLCGVLRVGVFGKYSGGCSMSINIDEVNKDFKNLALQQGRFSLTLNVFHKMIVLEKLFDSTYGGTTCCDLANEVEGDVLNKIWE